MAQPEKVAAVAELSNRFRDASAALLTEYRGLTTAQLTQLRRDLGSTTTYAVVKNTLTKRAAGEVGLSGLGALLKGPTAIAFVQGDPVEAAKGLRDFARANPTLVIKGGVVDGAELSAQEIGRLADLESREVLLGKLAGAMMANLSKAAGLFAGPALPDGAAGRGAAGEAPCRERRCREQRRRRRSDRDGCRQRSGRGIADAAPAEASADATPPASDEPSAEAPTDTAG